MVHKNQPQTKPLVLSGQPVIELHKWLEQMGHLIGWNANAGIPNRESNRIRPVCQDAQSDQADRHLA